MDFEPFGDKILAEVVAQDESKGGIKLPESVQKTSKIAVVLATGPSAGTALKAGNRIMFSRSTQITINDKPYIILTENDVIGIFKE